MISKRLRNLRELLCKYDFAGYIVPTTNEYLSEYTPTYAKRLEYITGFTGSNGLAIILKDKVLFFTDGRYINQCLLQLDDKLFEVFDLQLLPEFQWSDYIGDNMTIAYDPKLFTTWSLQNFSSIKLQAHFENLIDKIWSGQPARPSSKIYDYPLKYTGADYKDKIQKCRNVLEKNNAESIVITSADSVCWLLNIRAHDVEFSPLLLANVVITREHVYLFTNKDRLDKSLIRADVTILPDSEFASIIEQFGGMILFDENQCSSYIAGLIKIKKYKHIKNPCDLWKACKNDVEIQYMKQGHVQDAVAVCEMLAFIAHQDISDLTEYDLSQTLTALRRKGKNYVFDSFSTICGYQNNAAIVHYCADKKSARKIIGQGLLLIDSGGQYMGATTDITRTVVIGRPKIDYKKYYTKILKGHIALASAVFPQDKVTGAHLDVLARQYLWYDGDDYSHGTGHGVGSFLSVHEGPQNISLTGFSAKIEKGMVVSNEPGYYVPGEFGIRIENMMYARDAKDAGFLQFEMLTLVPYAIEMIDVHMLTATELEFLQSYYSEIYNKIFTLLSNSAQKWLKEQIEWVLVRE